ncbi:MAG: hypothetical protein GTN62_02150 [Gemmatimonadales bacterium]|nr:hypothetical protein [Gemmatimonadales bacterium]NIN12366.1 hypothetical protein [Gemmatimonadales bacterium]NIN48904.1 hypothetical protein [Gemmatimonadales bacterium]NIP06368.1 hypothetical protein [Gemmatimonadales bacterium]NIR00741.1 hypothetical protein [Gemmatimonadales bacterium]
MRLSTARLAETSVRLAELRFPLERVQIHRTRLAFIHLDNLLHFAKIDRDGRVDGFVVAYLPDEVTILLLRRGDLATAIAYAEGGRAVVSIATALKRIRQESERGELAYGYAPLEQLAWMYSCCAAPATAREVDQKHPDLLLTALEDEKFTGVLELISNGRVNYVRFNQGQILNGHFCDKPDGLSAPQYLLSLFAPDARGARPCIAAAVFPPADDLPEQAPPALIQTYRELFWSIVNAAEREVPGEATKRVKRHRDLLANVHKSLTALGTPLDRDPIDVVASPEELNYALSDWALQFLEELEIIAPGIAPGVVQEATREHRFVLQKAGFYDRLPWTMHW